MALEYAATSIYMQMSNVIFNTFFHDFDLFASAPMLSGVL